MSQESLLAKPLPAKPLRSVLYMPAANVRALEKAKTLPMDALIIDLEDATAFEHKITARNSLRAKLANKPYGDKLVAIRVNDQATEWFNADLKSAVTAKPDIILVPKVDNASQVTDILHQLAALDETATIKLWIMVETAQAILNINEIAALGKVSALDGLVFGTNDLAKEMLIPLPSAEYPERIGFLSYFSNCILAAKANGLAILDGVFNDFSNLDGLAYETRQAKQLGFDGKTLIHPKQIEIANTIFSPSAAEVEFAQKIITAFKLPENAGKGAINIDGKMVELLHAQMAEAMLAKIKFYDA